MRGIAENIGIPRNMVSRYVNSPGLPKAKLRAKRGSNLDAYREIRELGYEGSYTIRKDYVHPRRRPRQPKATVRFETGPGEQAQVDWGWSATRERTGAGIVCGYS